MNYLRHFGLREAPFGITPDTTYFFACRAIQQAFNTLVVAVSNGEGFIKITGEVGTGKTLLCRKFLGTLDGAWLSAYVPNPSFEPRTLYLALAEELGILVSANLDQHQLLKAITRALLDLARNRKRLVLCIDESQAMSLETLEALRLLTNLETEKRKLLQVVLFGQPELDRKLASPTIRQLLQRITFQHHLRGLEENEVCAYVAHRLAVGGFTGRSLLSPAALRVLHRASRGVPRLVNILMHKAMLLAYGEGRWTLERRDMRAAAADTPAAAPLAKWWWRLGLGRAGN
ncbi:MAG: AAA family ATPase [Betaproteobacteria bacterium RIFCSPLOWO2_12_FULL_65_14]|nr:MAG: AAA family ATPase [Betaproteobacteria bacterium RIFCSPLOWO2_12_FULL_65_14]